MSVRLIMPLKKRKQGKKDQISITISARVDTGRDITGTLCAHSAGSSTVFGQATVIITIDNGNEVGKR